MKDQIYHKLRKELDSRMPVGFPASPDGSDIALLKKVFTEDEAAIAIHLSLLPESSEKIHRRIQKEGLNLTIGELEDHLERMYKKGAIMGGPMFPKPRHYSLAQFVIGIYEFQVDRQDAEFAKYMEDYANGPLAHELFRHRPYQMRTIPIKESLPADFHAAPADDVYKIIDNAKEPVALVDCVCRQSQDLLSEPCRLSSVRNTCIMFGTAAEYYLDRNIPSARQVTKNELREKISLFSSEGFIFQPANTSNPGFICVCCGCCCHMLKAYKKLDNPSEHFTSSYIVEINPDLCNGCSKCVRRCQMDAITIENKTAVLNPDRCIGCGNCVITCKPEAITPVKKNKTPFIPRTSMSLYSRILLKKLGISGIAPLIWRLLTGRKK